MADAPKPIEKLLVANRGEIAIRIFRSATELGLRTVAVYTHEDRFALHRFKADQAFQVGGEGEPLGAYLDVENLVALCVREGVDAVHPGYGFLSENANFAEALGAAGVRFVGPTTDVLKRLGDKTSARTIAKAAGVPVLEGTDSVTDVDEAKTLADGMGYPVMLKAAHGGGGRGMRIVRKEKELADAFEGAQRESQTAFGSGEIFLERFIERARHLEVQLLGDGAGGLGPPAGAGLLRPAPAPKGRRDRPGPEPAGRRAGRAVRRGGEDRFAGRLPQRRDRRVPVRRG